MPCIQVPSALPSAYRLPETDNVTGVILIRQTGSTPQECKQVAIIRIICVNERNVILTIYLPWAMLSGDTVLVVLDSVCTK